MQKDQLEKDVRKMQTETDELENVYKELLLLSNEMKVIKRNMVPSKALDDGPEMAVSPRSSNNNGAP